MRTIILIVIILAAFVPFYCTFDNPNPNNPVNLNSIKDTLDLPCCNNNDPFDPDGICPDDDAQVSLACNDNGIKTEKMIKCSCCKEIWQRFGLYPSWQNIPCASVGGPSGLYCTEEWEH